VSPFVRLAIAELFSAEKRAADQLAGCCAALDGGFEIARRAGAPSINFTGECRFTFQPGRRRGSICFPRVDLFSLPAGRGKSVASRDGWTSSALVASSSREAEVEARVARTSRLAASLGR